VTDLRPRDFLSPPLQTCQGILASTEAGNGQPTPLILDRAKGPVEDVWQPGKPRQKTKYFIDIWEG
jgi:hypothetical protein